MRTAPGNALDVIRFCAISISSMARASPAGSPVNSTASRSAFDGADDVVAQVRSCLLRQMVPRDWFRANHGPWVAGSRLLRLLRRADPGISERSYLRLAEQIEACAPQRPS